MSEPTEGNENTTPNQKTENIGSAANEAAAAASRRPAVLPQSAASDLPGSASSAVRPQPRGKEPAPAVLPRSAATSNFARSASSAARPQPRISEGLAEAASRSAASAASAGYPRSAVSASGPSGTRIRKARLRLARIDPWSMMKTAFLFAVAGGIMFWVATYMTWGVIGHSGLFESIDKLIADVMSNPRDNNMVRIEDIITGNKVLGIAMIIAVLNTIISTALATLGAFLYNLAASMLGGLELTLAED